MDYQKQLRDFIPQHSFFAGVDSDGCVFDTMEVKQKEFFIPAAIKIFDLFSIAKPLRETWEFVNLYSSNRGVNRFPAFIKVFELLSQRPEVIDSGVILPDTSKLKEWVKLETKLSNATLRSHYLGNRDESIGKILEWSESINEEISRYFRGVPPFPYAAKVLTELNSFADTIVVSQTPLEALEREWQESGLFGHIRLIAAQEHGTKTEHIALAAKGRYLPEKILMIGDSRGDLEAASKNGILFFPIVPGKENESWKRLYSEGLGRFREGTFSGDYSETLVGEFLKALPSTPSWK